MINLGWIIELCLAYQRSVFDFAQPDIGCHTACRVGL